ncbi:MAG: L-threonylcarbamoyladenylate synthase [Paraglaciecola sp.]|jgi:L-threonylcarbamoyladenylate synthase
MTAKHTDDPLVTSFQAGKIFAYPTEAVFGLGCDPDNQEAVMALLSLKQRPVNKGLILVAKTYSQLLPYVNDAAIPMAMRTEIFSSWPGPITWLLPKSKTARDWLTGDSELIAVRVSQHPVIRDLCTRFAKPLVSTSANKKATEPARTIQQVQEYFNDTVLLVEGELGNALLPSKIRHGLSGQTIRDN